MADVSLSEAIASLRTELQQAMDEGAGSPLRFLVSSIDVELEVAVTTKASGKASASLWKVLTAETGAERDQSHIHRINLSLSPQTEDGSGVQIADELEERPR